MFRLLTLMFETVGQNFYIILYYYNKIAKLRLKSQNYIR